MGEERKRRRKTERDSWRKAEREVGEHAEGAPAFAFPHPRYESRSLVCYSMVCASEDVSAVSLGREESDSEDGVAYKMAPAERGRGRGGGVRERERRIEREEEGKRDMEYVIAWECVLLLHAPGESTLAASERDACTDESSRNKLQEQESEREGVRE